MNGVNRHAVLGFLGADPEVRYTDSGLAIATLSVGASYRTKEDDEWVEKTDWVRVTLFGQKAEYAEQYIEKGHLVYIEGPQKTRSYEDSEGNTRYSTETHANVMNHYGRLAKRGSDESNDDFDIPF